MRRTFALTMALGLASLGMSAYAQTTPATQGQQPQTQTTRKHKKAKKEKKDKVKATHAAAEKK